MSELHLGEMKFPLKGEGVTVTDRIVLYIIMVNILYCGSGVLTACFFPTMQEAVTGEEE